MQGRILEYKLNQISRLTGSEGCRRAQEQARQFRLSFGLASGAKGAPKKAQLVGCEAELRFLSVFVSA